MGTWIFNIVGVHRLPVIRQGNPPNKQSISSQPPPITKKQRTRQSHRRNNWQAPAKSESIQKTRNRPQVIEAFQKKTTIMCVHRTHNRMCAKCEDVVVSTDHKIVQCGQFDRRNETHRRRGHCGTLEVWTLAYPSPGKCDGCQDMKGGSRR